MTAEPGPGVAVGVRVHGLALDVLRVGAVTVWSGRLWLTAADGTARHGSRPTALGSLGARGAEQEGVTGGRGDGGLRVRQQEQDDTDGSRRSRDRNAG